MMEEEKFAIFVGFVDRGFENRSPPIIAFEYEDDAAKWKAETDSEERSYVLVELKSK